MTNHSTTDLAAYLLTLVPEHTSTASERPYVHLTSGDHDRLRECQGPCVECIWVAPLS